MAIWSGCCPSTYRWLKQCYQGIVITKNPLDRPERMKFTSNVFPSIHNGLLLDYTTLKMSIGHLIQLFFCMTIVLAIGYFHKINNLKHYKAMPDFSHQKGWLTSIGWWKVLSTLSKYDEILFRFMFQYLHIFAPFRIGETTGYLLLNALSKHSVMLYTGCSN